MGCYGIGLSRLMGTIVEVCSDENGIVWPKSVSPFQVHLISVGNDQAVLDATKLVYDQLQKNNIEVLWDDRDTRPGQKFADSDLIGLPTRVVVSNKTIEEKKLEVKDRKTGDIKHLSIDELISDLK